MTTSQKLYDSLQNGYKVRTTINASNEHVQHVRLDPDYPSGDQAPITVTETTLNLTANDGRLVAVAANSNGNHGYLVAPKSNTATVYLSFNSPADADGYPIYPGGVFQLTANFGGRPLTNAVYYYTTTAGQKLKRAVG